MNLKIKVFGYRGLFNITELLETEFKNLGHELVDHEPDYLLHLTGPFDEADSFYSKCIKPPIRLYCLLDIDSQKDISWYGLVKEDLESCEIPCVISETVEKQVKERLNVEKKLNIIYYPIRKITFENYYKSVSFLYTGRLYAENKRFGLVLNTLKRLGLDTETLVVAGTESYPNVTYIKSPNDDLLNEIYNSSKFLLSPSSFEGLNLNMISAVITNTFPIVCNDCKVVHEFGLSGFATDPTPQALAKKINEIEVNPKRYLEILKELRPKFIEQFNIKTFANRIINLYNEVK